MFKTQEEKLSYALGISLGKNISSLNQTLNHPALFKGIQDGISGKAPLLSEEEMHSSISSFDQILSIKEVELNLKKQSEAFLSDNALKPGVVTLPSGVQYKIVQMGEGPTPKKTNRVLVHYRGFLIDATEFANTYQVGHPEVFYVDQMIQGWIEVLQLMKVGDIWHVYLPPELAYGKEGYADVVPPNSAIAFQIELVGIL